MQLGIAIMRMHDVSRPAHPLELTNRIEQRIRARFPFELTEAQNRAVSEIAGNYGISRVRVYQYLKLLTLDQKIIDYFLNLKVEAKRKSAEANHPDAAIERRRNEFILLYCDVQDGQIPRRHG